MDSRILIVGTVPYNKKMTSRAFDAYFGDMDHSCLAQIFSYPSTPPKGHCSALYQITDAMLLRKVLGKSVTVGKRWKYEELPDITAADVERKDNNRLYRKLYRIGSRKNAFTCLLRKWLWKQKRWCTEDLNNWLDEFSPECVFLSFSDDFFIPEIALYVAEKYDIPIVSSIGDDYFFNDRFSCNPFYHIYRKKYKKLIRKVFAHGGSAIYISDKIRDKYNGEFALDGETVYLSSEVEHRAFRPINTEDPDICYFGNIRQGRNESLSEIASALGTINPQYRLTVCSAQNDKDIVKVLTDNPNVDFLGAIPYEEVKKRSAKADVLVIVEGFKQKHINMTRYSLSTKAADSIRSGASIFVYGSPECGVTEYMQGTGCAEVCTDRSQLPDRLKHLLFSEEYQKANYKKAEEVYEHNHVPSQSRAVFRKVVKKAIDSYEKTRKI